MPAKLCLKEAETMAFAIISKWGQKGIRLILDLKYQRPLLHLPTQGNPKAPETGKGGEVYLPKHNACYEVKKPKCVHDIPQISKIIHPIHVPLQHRKGQRERASAAGKHQLVPDFFFKCSYIFFEPTVCTPSYPVIFQGDWKVGCMLTVLLCMCC